MLARLYERSDSPNPKLRIGLLLDNLEIPAAFSEVIDHINGSNFARIELLIFNMQAAAGMERSRRALPIRVVNVLRDAKRRKYVLFQLYQKFDRRMNPVLEHPDCPVDCSGKLAHVQSIKVAPIIKGFVHRFSEESITEIKARNLDVLIRFGFNILRGEILNAARYGIWSYHHGDNEYYRGGPSCFWEVYEGARTTGVILQRLTEKLDDGVVIHKGVFPTCPGYSRYANMLQPYWGASTFVIQKLKELHEYGWQHIYSRCVESQPYKGRKKIYTVPNNAELAAWLGPLILRKALRRAFRRPGFGHWKIGIRKGSSPVAQTGVPDVAGFEWIESPESRFFADPFLAEGDGRTFLFFEDFDYSRKKGRISFLEIQESGIGPVQCALERPYHLSYPCVFRDGNDWFMIPESLDNKTIELYRCSSFPETWKFEKTLFKGLAVDTTAWQQDGRYWFFTTLVERRSSAGQLWLFHSDSLTGDWTAHPANPISTDIRNVRSAGALFRHGSRLLRPTQDGAIRYGRSFTLNEVQKLNSVEFIQTPWVSVEPTALKNLMATHSYALHKQIEVIDGLHWTKGQPGGSATLE